MSRKEGTLKLSSNIEPRASAPLDARLVVPTLADLTASGAFPYPYVGMIVSVQSAGKAYMLTANNPTVAANWVEIGSSGVTIVDALPTSPNIENKIYGIDASTTSTIETTANVAELRKVDGLEYNLLTTTFTPKEGYEFSQASSTITSIVYDNSGADPVYTINYNGGTSIDLAEDDSIIFTVNETITDYYIGNAGTQLLTAVEQGVVYEYLTAADIDALMNSVAASHWDYLAQVITDNVISTAKVWSSNKTNVELGNTLDAAKEYTDEQISRFRSTSYYLVSSTAEMVNPSVLYLLPIIGEDDNYAIYALIKDSDDNYVPTEIGTTQANLDDYYTKSEADARFVQATNIVTLVKYGNEVGDVSQLDSSFSSSDIVGCLNELTVFETTNIDWSQF